MRRRAPIAAALAIQMSTMATSPLARAAEIVVTTTADELVRSQNFTAQADYRRLRVLIQLAKGSGSASFDDVSLIRE